MTIFVCETDLYTDVPRIKQYTGVEVRPTGVVVKKYGARKFIPNALGRKFFTDEAELRKFCLGWLRRKRELLKGQLQKVEAWLGRDSTPTLELTIDVQRAEPIPPVKNLRLADADPPSYLDD